MVENNNCKCNKPEIQGKNQDGCTLNQVIECHGDEPFKNVMKHSCGCGCHEAEKNQ